MHPWWLGWADIIYLNIFLHYIDYVCFNKIYQSNTLRRTTYPLINEFLLKVASFNHEIEIIYCYNYSFNFTIAIALVIIHVQLLTLTLSLRGQCERVLKMSGV